MFLYLLNMEKSSMFKVGIATDFSRIKQHMSTYKGLINLKKSYIINAKEDSTIKLFEKQILEDYKEFKIDEETFKGKDGYTELLDIKVLNDVLDDIKYKKNKLPSKNIQISQKIMMLDKKVSLDKCIAKNIQIIREETKLNTKIVETIINNFKNFSIYDLDFIYENENVYIQSISLELNTNIAKEILESMIKLNFKNKNSQDVIIFSNFKEIIKDKYYKLYFLKQKYDSYTKTFALKLNKQLNILSNCEFYNNYIISKFLDTISNFKIENILLNNEKKFAGIIFQKNSYTMSEMLYKVKNTWEQYNNNSEIPFLVFIDGREIVKVDLFAYNKNEVYLFYGENKYRKHNIYKFDELEKNIKKNIEILMERNL